MNSSHTQVAPQPFADWLSKAKRKFVGATLHNSGRYCVAVMNHVDVYAFETYDDAAVFMAGHPQYRLYDLAHAPVHKLNLSCGNITSQVEADDRRQERREQRERQQKLQPQQ